MQQLNAPLRYRLMAVDLLEFLPRVPQRIEDTGLPYTLIQDLVLRRLFLSSSISGMDLSDALHLPYNGVIEGVLNTLYKDKLVEFTGGQGYGRPYFDYLLTEAGRERARDAFERCAYVGPAPVPLEMFVNIVRSQVREVPRVTRQDLESAFHDMVLEPAFFDRLGPAVNSVRSLFLYGAPGNGKTSMAERIATILRGEIFVPYAIEVDSQIIKVYDPLVHREVQPLPDLASGGPPSAAGMRTGGHAIADDDEDSELSTLSDYDVMAQLNNLGRLDEDDARTVEVSIPGYGRRPQTETTDGNLGKIMELPPFDRRFVLSFRPHIVVGGELTLEALDLTWSPNGRYYEAPYQIKAACGMLLIDDFGRQKVHPTDLLNRWIVPLEKKIDFLTLLTGKKFEVPFELLIIFSTNLDPARLVDEAFLRRIRYKIEVGDPSERVFRGIFKKEAQRQNVRFDPVVLDHVLHRFYHKTGRSFRGCHPRDILQLLVDQARFLNTEAVMSRRLMEQACESYFVHLEGNRTGYSAVEPRGEPQSAHRAVPPTGMQEVEEASSTGTIGPGQRAGVTQAAGTPAAGAPAEGARASGARSTGPRLPDPPTPPAGLLPPQVESLF